MEDIGEDDALAPVGTLSQAALMVQRGVSRMLGRQNIACLQEVSLPNKRRADLVAVLPKGELWIIEIKSGLPDFQADQKWPDYLAFCDRFFFAIDADFPRDRLPDNIGIILADAYDAEIIVAAPHHKLAAARRHAMTRRLARIGAFRAMRQADPRRRNMIFDGNKD